MPPIIVARRRGAEHRAGDRGSPQVSSGFIVLVMVSAYAHNDLLLGIIDVVTGNDADLELAEQAFRLCPGDFVARFAAAVQAVVADQVRPEVFIQIPQQRQELSKAELERLVRPAAAYLKSYPSRPELLEELGRIENRQQRRPDWIPRITADGKPLDADDPEPDEPEREMTVEAFPELGQIAVRLPAAGDERPELTLAGGGIGQLELAFYRLLGIGGDGDWRGDLVLDAEANEALVPADVRWWAHGDDPRALAPADDAGVASELLATVPTLGGVPVRETDGSIEVVARALAGAGFWRHSPQWILQSWEPGDAAALFTVARASLSAWADETGSGLLVHVDGAVLHQQDGILGSPGPLHSYLLCVTRASSGSDEPAIVHRLVLSCPGEHWCRRGGCATADAATAQVLAALLAPVGQSAQLSAACRHDYAGVYQDLYGSGSNNTIAEPVLEVCAAVLEQAGWKELSRAEIEGGMQELLVRRADRFLTLMHDPVTRQIMLRDGTSDLDLMMQMLHEDGVIIPSGELEIVDTSEQVVEVWGLDVLTAASDVLRGRVSTDQEPAFDAVQATLLGLHPAGLGAVNVPGAQSLCQAQLTQLLRNIGADSRPA